VNEPTDGMLTLMGWEHSVVSAPTCQSHRSYAIQKCHKIAIVDAESSGRKDVVEFPREAGRFSVLNEMIPLVRIRREERLVMSAFGSANEALIVNPFTRQCLPISIRKSQRGGSN
jgi:hypothetical protein